MKNPLISLLLKIALRLHGLLYKVISFLAVKKEGGVHPKHRILNYHQFFLDNIEKDSKVLDIGCSEGDLTFELAKKAKKVVGIDLNEKYLNKAKKNRSAQNIDYIFGDAASFNFKEKFDFAVLSNVLEHIEKREDFLRKIGLIARKILIRAPLLTRDWLVVYKKEMGISYLLDKTHYIEHTKEQFIKEIEKAGIEIEKVEINFGEIYAIAHKTNN